MHHLNAHEYMSEIDFDKPMHLHKAALLQRDSEHLDKHYGRFIILLKIHSRMR